MEKTNKVQNLQRRTPVVWDCGSSLYDSFELDSLKRQLDSAVVSRTLSMPHLDSRRAAPPPQPQPQQASNSAVSKRSSSSSSKISRSLNRLLKSLFRSYKQNSSSSVLKMRERQLQEGNCVFLYDKTGALTTIPEGPEIDLGGGISPDISSLARRSVSERFAASSIAISCA